MLDSYREPLTSSRAGTAIAGLEWWDGTEYSIEIDCSIINEEGRGEYVDLIDGSERIINTTTGDKTNISLDSPVGNWLYRLIENGDYEVMESDYC